MINRREFKRSRPQIEIMKQLPRILMFFAALSLLALFVAPMWRITLIAPQYPDGVTMYIWINKISGETAGTLQNINILNHYIGMKAIEPDSIPELQYFQYVVMALIALGIIIAFTNNKRLFLSWTILLIILGAASIYDFYLWEYDYGHTLDPNAPMKFEGASFQPPLIGTKNIINFVAKSFPHTAGYFIGLAIFLGGAAWWLKNKNDKKKDEIPNSLTSISVPRERLHA